MKKNQLTESQKNLLNAHSKYLSRRDFVSLGLWAAGGVLLAPTIGTSLAASFAKNLVGEKFVSDMPAFLTFDLAGGASMSGNFLVGKEGGPEDLLKSYSQMGWDPRADGYDKRFGLPMAKPQISKVMQGMLEVMSAGAQANFKMGSIHHIARDDTSDNPLSILGLVGKAGKKGSSLSIGAGMLQTLSGGNSKSTKEVAEYRPVFIESVDDLNNASSIAAPLRDLGTSAMQKIFRQLRNISVSQAQQVLSGTDPKALGQFAEMHDAATNASFATVDPRTKAETQSIYGVSANSTVNDLAVVRSTISLAAISGYSGGGVITIGGCDYHDGTQSTGDNKDLEIGREIGRAVELAHRMKTKLFVHVITDGSLSAQEGTRKWSNENGEKCFSVIGYYDPTKVPQYGSGGMQVGNFTDGQGADRATFVGSSPAIASYVAFANYLNLSGKLGDFENIVGSRVFEAGQLDKSLIFSA